MGAREWEMDDVVEFLREVQEINRNHWLDHERRLLPDQEIPSQTKQDFASVLEVVNLIHEDKFPLAVERFGSLTETQQTMFQMIVEAEAREFICPDCAAEQKEKERLEQEKRDDAARHFRHMQEISRSRVYQVSEDIYERLEQRSAQLQQIIGRLEQTVKLLPEQDPRHTFADDLLGIIYEC